MGGKPVQGAELRTPTPASNARLDLDGEVQQIADRVRRVAVAGSVYISAVVDTERLEIVAASGAVPGGSSVVGRTWRRLDLDHCLADAERRGRLFFTRRRSLTYAELPHGGDPTGLRSDHGTLLAALRSGDGELVGVLSAVGPVEPRTLGAAACDLLEVYADQARMVLGHLRERDRLGEQLRLAQSTQSVLHHAAAQSDVSALLESVAGSVVEMLRAQGSWVCAETEVGTHADAASYPGEVATRLGPDICTVVEPVVSICRHGDRVLTEADHETIAVLAAHTGHEHALFVAIGSGTPVRGGLLVFRDAGDPSWSDDERSAVLTLARRLGSVIRNVDVRSRDRRLVAELRELDRYKRDLVASLSHDLKTPLTSITLNTELLEADHETVGSGGSHVAAIRRSAERLGRLVDDLMALARAEETVTGSSPEVDVVALVMEALHHVEVEAQQREVRLRVQLPDALPCAVDADALRRVFVQLVSNAVKFSLPAGEVRLGLRRVGDVVEFRCSDDGIGIAESDQRTVFDMFGRSTDARDRGVPGSGMGLAIAHRIVTRLGGSIEVDSAQGRGATFTVRVPADLALE